MLNWATASEISRLYLPNYPTSIAGIRRKAINDGVPVKKSGNRYFFYVPDIEKQAFNRKLINQTVTIDEEQKINLRLKKDLLSAYIGRVEAANYNDKQNVREAFEWEYNNGVILNDIYEKLGAKSWKTLERWKLKLRDEGEDSLIDTRGGREFIYQFSNEEKLILIAGIKHPHGLLKKEMVRFFRRSLAERGMPPCQASDQTIIRWINRWINDHYDQYIQATEGHRALLNKVAPHLRRDWNLIEVGECLVADGHDINGFAVHPITGKRCRPVLILFYDMRSNFPLGFEVMVSENIRAIGAAYRRSVIRLGKKPKYVYLDNGKAFRAKFFRGCKDFKQAGIAPLYEKIGSTPIFAKVRNARSKPVERFFKDFGELERLSPAYTGTNIKDKPPYLLQGETLHQRFWEKMTGGRYPTIEEWYYAILNWFENEYAYRKQEGSHLNGARPIDVLNTGLGTGIDMNELDEMMLFEDDRPLTANGVRLRINGMDEFFYNEAFYGKKRKKLRVRFDRYAIVSKVINWVDVWLDDQWVRAYRRVKTHPLATYEGTKEQQAEVTRQIEQQNRLVKQTEKDFRKAIEADYVYYNQLPEPEPVSTPKNEAQPKPPIMDTDQLLAEVAVLEKDITIDHPRLFNSEVERYEWLVKQDDNHLTDKDRQFMAEYRKENSRE